MDALRSPRQPGTKLACREFKTVAEELREKEVAGQLLGGMNTIPEFKDGMISKAEHMRQMLIDSSFNLIITRRRVHTLTVEGQIYAKQLAAAKSE